MAGGAWWWDSGLVVPQDEWSYVALIATADSITLYLNEQKSTHHTNLDPVQISSFKIGSYQGWASRNFSGEIDEVAIWEYALTDEDIKLNRHLTKETILDDMLLYYQFNEADSRILDKAGLHHAFPAGNTERIDSDGPFGKGRSNLLKVEAPGSHNFTSVGLYIRFQEDPLPIGEIVVSRIESLPDKRPDRLSTSSVYWILDYYGQNESFAPAAEVHFGGAVDLTGLDANPEDFNLYLRDRNAGDHEWNESYSPDDYSGTTVVDFIFNESEITSSTQMILGFDSLGVSTSVETMPVSSGPKVYPTLLKKNQPLYIDSGLEDFHFVLFGEEGNQLIVARGNQSAQVSTEALGAGIYFYQLVSGTKWVNGKVVVVER